MVAFFLFPMEINIFHIIFASDKKNPITLLDILYFPFRGVEYKKG